MSDTPNNQNEKIRRKEDRALAIHDLVNGKAVYVMAFLIPLVIMIAIFMIRDIFPFGTNCHLRSDMYHQYAPFFSELWEKIRTGGSLTYSWDIGMGTNYLAIYGYYLSSPTNWFIALFPQKYMIEIMNAIILLKLAGSSLTCTLYLCHHHKKRHLSAAVFGLFYGLSAFVAAYSWNLMWLDCVLLLPLVVLGLEKLVNEGKGLLYAITLGFTILSNYYIAIMVCISMVIYFVVSLVSRPVLEDKADYARITLRFIIYSILAGGFAAILLLPEVYALEYTASSNINFPDVLTRYFSFVTIIKRHLINVKVSTGLDHMPNIYCGVAVIVLFPLYIMNKKLSKREKIMKVLALFIFFTAFNMNIPNFIWHGFHYPNSLPCRQSFIYIFLLLTMCYDAFKNIKNYKDSELAGSLWGVLLFLIYIGNTLTDNDIDFKVLYTSAIFIALYILIAFIGRRKKINTNYLMIALFAVAIVECTMNMENTGYSTTDRTYYLSDYDSIDTLTAKVDEIEDDNSFYRISKAWGYRSKNDSAWHNFKGESTFSSTAYASLTKLYGQLGLEHSTNAYAINGATPLIYSMFDVKYLLSNKLLADDSLLSLVDTNNGEYLYQSNYTLPLAFMLPEDFNSNWIYAEEANPFAVQNSFAENAAGVTDLFTQIDFTDNLQTATINTTKDQRIYLYIMNKQIETVSVSIDGVTETYRGINHGRMIDLGYIKSGSEVYIYDTDSKGQGLQLYAYTMDEDKFIQVYNALNDEGLEITSYNDTHINGEITASEDGLMYTSIPYDESYTVYVDGKKTEYTKIGDAFIGVYLTSGTHTIQFHYVPRGLKPGIAISAICVLILIGCIIFRVKFKKEISEDGALSILWTKDVQDDIVDDKAEASSPIDDEIIDGTTASTENAENKQELKG